MSAAMPVQTSGDLAAFYSTRTKEKLGELPPPHMVSSISKQCDQLLSNGNSPRMIRRGLEILIQRRKHPMLLQHTVWDALQGQRACMWARHPNTFRLTPDQLRECGCTDCLETIPYSDFYDG